MLTHIVIMLDDTSISYCHYNNVDRRRLMALEDLKAGIKWAMKENLNIQFVYPDYDLPTEYIEVIDTIDHTNIKPETQAESADVVVLADWNSLISEAIKGKVCVLRTNRMELKENDNKIKNLMDKASRIIIVLTDIESFSDNDIMSYQSILERLSEHLCNTFNLGNAVQMSLLTDRIMLNEMNNCNAGVNNITLAPNGSFYLCPAFYYDNPEDNYGDLKRGLTIKNAKLLQLDHAPICRNCDAYHCRRCIWMNSKLTLDYNTPSHQQCVIAHVERNTSRELLERLKEIDIRLSPTYEIKELNYLDPFNKYSK